MKVYLAYILDLILGDPEGYPHPVRLIGSLISKEERIIRKYAKGEKALKIAGFVMCLFTTAVAYFVTYLLIYLVGFINCYFPIFPRSSAHIHNSCDKRPGKSSLQSF